MFGYSVISKKQLEEITRRMGLLEQINAVQEAQIDLLRQINSAQENRVDGLIQTIAILKDTIAIG